MFRTSLLSFALAWLSQWVLWLIFAKNAGYREMVAGASAAALATWFMFIFVKRTGERFRIRFRYAVQAVRIPAALASDTVTVFGAIAKRLTGAPVRGEIAAVPFEVSERSPEERARRALATTYLTLTPNTLVFGALPKEQLFLFHRLAPRPLPRFLAVFDAPLRPGS